MFCWLPDALLLMSDLQGKQGPGTCARQESETYAVSFWPLKASIHGEAQAERRSSPPAMLPRTRCVLVGAYAYCAMHHDCQQGLSKHPPNRVFPAQRASREQTHNPMCKWGLQHDARVLTAFQNSLPSRKQSIGDQKTKQKQSLRD